MITDIAPGIVLVDVVAQLPQHRTKRWPKRDASKIDRLYVHHSGKLGADGLAGLQNSAAYSVRDKVRRNADGEIVKRIAGWAGCPYTFWLPYRPVMHGRRLIAYRCNHDEARTFHTGGRANETGVGLALQGNTTARAMSDSQIELLEGVLPWAAEHYGWTGDDWLSWHSESKQHGGSGKPSCPGAHAVRWLTEYRAGHVTSGALAV